MNNKLNVLLVLLLFLGIGLAYNLTAAKSNNPQTSREAKFPDGRIDGYNLLGNDFAYYKIPSGLSREELIATAQRLHEAEPTAQLILVDDDSQVQDYIEFAKTINPGYQDKKMPKEWADQHIIANVQKYLNGQYALCEGYGYKEIAILK